MSTDTLKTIDPALAAKVCRLGETDALFELRGDPLELRQFRTRRALFGNRAETAGARVRIDSVKPGAGKAAVIVNCIENPDTILILQRLAALYPELWVVCPDDRLGADAFDELARCLALVDRISVHPQRKDMESLETVDIYNDRRVFTHREYGGRWQKYLRPDYNAPERHVLMHVHIPKNGGTSFHQLLVDNYEAQYFPVYYGNPKRRHNYESIVRHLMENSSIRAMASHGFRQYPHRFGPRIPLYICFLRNPRDRALSYFRYVLKDWDVLAPEHKRALPENLPEMTAKEFFQWRSKNANVFNPMDAQTNYLSGTNNWEMARRTLERFFFVGITERYEESMCVLKHKLDLIGFSLRYEAIPRLNATQKQNASGTTDARSDEQDIEPYLAQANADKCLYQWANAQLDNVLQTINS